MGRKPRQYSLLGTALAAALALTACGTGSAPQAQPTKTVTATASTESSSPSPSESASSSESSSESPFPSESSSASSSESSSSTESASPSSSSSESASPSASSSSSTSETGNVTYSEAAGNKIKAALGQKYVALPPSTVTKNIEQYKGILKIASISPEACKEYAISSNLYMPDNSTLAMLLDQDTMTAVSVAEAKSGELAPMSEIADGAKQCSTVKVKAMGENLTVSTSFKETTTPKGAKAYVMKVSQNGKATPDQVYFDHDGKRASLQRMGGSGDTASALLAEADKVIAALDKTK